jgi:hypothetical protein
MTLRFGDVPPGGALAGLNAVQARDRARNTVSDRTIADMLKPAWIPAEPFPAFQVCCALRALTHDRYVSSLFVADYHNTPERKRLRSGVP